MELAIQVSKCLNRELLRLGMSGNRTSKKPKKYKRKIEMTPVFTESEAKDKEFIKRKIQVWLEQAFKDKIIKEINYIQIEEVNLNKEFNSKVVKILMLEK